MKKRKISPILYAAALILAAVVLLFWIRWISDGTASHEQASAWTLEIKTSPEGMDRLKAKRKEALRFGVLISTGDDWVDATVVSGDGTEHKAEIRLKGDWVGGLKGKKWPFRIKLKSGGYWNGLATFSVHHPEARHYLDEWVFHRLLEQEDVLTTRYGFLRLKLNGRPLGIYAWEEFFEKQLVEHRGRREGPIVRFSEDGLWEIRKRQNLNKGRLEDKLPLFRAAPAEPFKKKKTFRSKTLSDAFQRAQDLLYAYKHHLAEASDIFDINRMARFLALSDLAGAGHALIWHNMRFYYNPLTARLEPVAYDAYIEDGVFPVTHKPFLGYQVDTARLRGTSYYNNIYYRLLGDRSLMTAYIRCLDRYTSGAFLDSFFSANGNTVDSLERLMRNEFKTYRYDREFLQKNAVAIRQLLYPSDPYALQAWQQTDGRIAIENYHGLPMELIGYGESGQRTDIFLPDPLWIPAYSGNGPPDRMFFMPLVKAKYVYFRLPGTESEYRVEVKPWSAPDKPVPLPPLPVQWPPDPDAGYFVDGKNVIIPCGLLETYEDIVIPPGYSVLISAGARINLTNGAVFFCRSPITIAGTADQPVEIYSSDHTSGGFVILEAGHAEITHAWFHGLGATQHPGWTLTGAVTAYKTEVWIANSAFTGNLSEDALNLIHCRFRMKDVTFSQTRSDAFDADFCSGEISDSRFLDIGNDAIDLSGSTVTVRNCQVKEAGDKALSGGERSVIHVYDLSVSEVSCGIASKDLSKIFAQGVQVDSTGIAFRAFRKKPEFGPGWLYVSDYSLGNVQKVSEAEAGSTLELNQ